MMRMHSHACPLMTTAVLGYGRRKSASNRTNRIGMGDIYRLTAAIELARNMLRPGDMIAPVFAVTGA